MIKTIKSQICQARFSFSRPAIVALLLAGLTLSASAAAFAEPVRPAAEQRKIEALISAVEASGATFIRNGSEYEAGRAADHMRMKLERAGSRVQTAEQFIEGVATRSYLTGRPYYIQFPDGRKVKSGEWLHNKLAQLEAPAGSEACCSLNR